MIITNHTIDHRKDHNSNKYQFPFIAPVGVWGHPGFDLDRHSKAGVARSYCASIARAYRPIAWNWSTPISFGSTAANSFWFFRWNVVSHGNNLKNVWNLIFPAEVAVFLGLKMGKPSSLADSRSIQLPRNAIFRSSRLKLDEGLDRDQIPCSTSSLVKFNGTKWSDLFWATSQVAWEFGPALEAAGALLPMPDAVSLCPLANLRDFVKNSMTTLW